MHPDAVRSALDAEVCSLSDAIVQGRDPRTAAFESADDPIQRCVARNPDYLAVVEAAYEGSRERFAGDLAHSLALLGEDDIDHAHVTTRADRLIAAQRAVGACAFNRFALFYLTMHQYQHRRPDDPDGVLAVVDYARRTLALSPGDLSIRSMAATAANLLGWHEEAASLAAPLVRESVRSGDALQSYRGAREYADALVLALRDHLWEDRPGLPCSGAASDPFLSLDSGVVAFGVWSKQGATDDAARTLDRLRKELYRTAWEATRNRAVATGRVSTTAPAGARSDG